jgi:hypothetical protein
MPQKALLTNENLPSVKAMKADILSITLLFPGTLIFGDESR